MYKSPKIMKVSATGNDFLLVDGRKAGIQGIESRSRWAKAVCDRQECLGADGALFLESDPQGEVDFQWDFYNSDGGSAEMCGNAARAVAWYVHQNEGLRSLRFRTRAGVIRARILGPGQVDVQLPPVVERLWNQTYEDLTYAFVSAGVPHAVVACASIEDQTQLRQIALRLKKSPTFQPAGVNVTFLYTVSATHVQSVTFERGVEDFTRSCGTGAVAAALTQLQNAQNIQVEVEVPGGRLFVVDKNDGPLLTGPAKVIAEISLLEDPT